MKFFDIIFIGRIFNRFFKDMDEVDVWLLFQVEMFIQNVILVFFCVGMIVGVFLWFFVVVGFFVIFFLVLYIVFRVLIWELKCLDNIMQLFFFFYIMFSIQGFVIIYVYNKGQEFLYRYQELLDDNQVFFFLFMCVMWWLVVWLDFISIVFIIIMGLMIVFMYGQIFLVYVGFVIFYVVQLMGLFQFMVRLVFEIEV